MRSIGGPGVVGTVAAILWVELSERGGGSLATPCGRDLLTVEAGLPVLAVAQRMADRNVGAVLVLEGGRLAGIMTERDLMRALARGLRDDTVVGECMTANPDTIALDDTIEHAAVLMIHGGYRHLPVVDGNDVVGVLSIRDLVQVVVEDSAPRGA